MAKQHNFTPVERARNAGWGMAYRMVLSGQMDLDDTQFKIDSLGLVYSKAESEAYDQAKQAYLIQQH